MVMEPMSGDQKFGPVLSQPVQKVIYRFGRPGYFKWLVFKKVGKHFPYLRMPVCKKHPNGMVMR